jgi:hypothetical protein
MRRTVLLAPLLAVSLLAGCAPASATYKLDFSISDSTQRQNLTKLAMAVIERRVNHLEDTIKNITPSGGDNDKSITVTVGKASTIEDLTRELTTPITFRVIEESPTSGTGTFTIGDSGPFRETGFTERQVNFVEWMEDPSNGKGAVNINLTPDGTQMLRSISDRNDGKTIGILVRDVLVSRTVGQKGQDKLIIRGIPSPEMARIFSDDVNVGLHVTFTPVP